MPTAFVTGASRGIGRAVAVALARRGYDVALTSRTVEDGERREHSVTVRGSDTRPIPGSLTSTAELIKELGRVAMVLPADLLDPKSVVDAARTAIDCWGALDVLVNNGRYVGPGHMDFFLDTPLDLIRSQIEANILSPLYLIQAVLPYMIRAQGGTIVNITSSAAFSAPRAAAGQGGWGLGYAITKAGLHRAAGVLSAEYAAQGIRVFNVNPGFVTTERTELAMGRFGFDPTRGASPQLVGEAVARLVTSATGDLPGGGTFHVQDGERFGEDV